MRQQSTDLVVESISKDIADQLAAGKDVSYSAVSTGDALSTQRVAANENEAQLSSATYTSEGTFAEAADISKDHVTYGAAVADAQGISGVIIEGTPTQAAAEVEAPKDEGQTPPAQAPESTPTS
jgi:hypothetical protein